MKQTDNNKETIKELRESLGATKTPIVKDLIVERIKKLKEKTVVK